jgi:large subunit ribosomal protein L25
VTNVEITAEPRTDFGKGAARRLRRSGNVPAVIYGSGMELTHVALDEHSIDLALRKPRVVLNVNYGGTTYLTKPRDVQRDPVKRNVEHVDLIIITKQEAAIRSSYADAVAKAEIAAAEAGYDSASVIMALEEAVARGEDPLEAVDHAVEDVKNKAQEMAAAAAAREAAREAAEAETGGEVAEGSTETSADESAAE